MRNLATVLNLKSDPKNETLHHLCPNRKIGYTSGCRFSEPGSEQRRTSRHAEPRLSNAAQKPRGSPNSRVYQ
jgi:hypothetical protein